MSLNGIQTILWVIGLGTLFICAGTDLKDRIIPNELVLATAITGLLLCFAQRPGQFFLSLAAAVLMLFLLGLLCRCGVLGGGDAKLMAAVTFLVPPYGIGVVMMMIVLAGGALSLLYILAGGVLRLAGVNPTDLKAGRPDTVTSFADWMHVECGRIASCNHVPYAVSILSGVLWYYFAIERLNVRP